MKRTATLAFTKFRAWEVVVPIRNDILYAPETGAAMYAANLNWGELPIHLVEGTTSAGFTAVGECGRGTTRETAEATLRGLLGVDLLSTTPAIMWMQSNDVGGLPLTYPALSSQVAGGRSYPLMESLWLDAVGKAANLPAHQLLGGAVRKEVAVDFWANRPPAKTLAKLVKEAVKRGLRGMKLKSDGAGDTVQSIANMARDLPRGFRFTIDPMCAWRTFRQSRRFFEQLAALPCEIQVEDPFRWEVVDDWHRARELGTCTIICHVREEMVLRNALRDEIADAFNLGGTGAYEFLRAATVAEFAQKDCWLGSALELGVLQHVRLHSAACARNCVLASDLQSEWVRAHTLITPRMSYRDGRALVPTIPGLGIELDRKALAKYAKRTFEIR